MTVADHQHERLVERRRHCSDAVVAAVGLTGQVAEGGRRLLSDAHVERVGGHAGRPDGQGRAPAGGRQPPGAEPLEGAEQEAP